MKINITVFLLTSIVINASFSGCIENNDDTDDFSVKINGFTFPRDEGRHKNYDESWYFCFNLISDNGYEYSFHSQFGTGKDVNLCLKFCSFTNISSNQYFFKTDKQPTGDYFIDDSKLNITFDHYSHTDRIYQIDNKLFHYNYSVGLTDRNLNPIILNCSMISNKDPIKINDTLINEKIFDNPLNKLFYYAQTNIDVFGKLLINGTFINVTGTAWIDREWGEETMATIEWFAIQLDNDYEIAASKIYKNAENFSLGMIILPNGDTIDIHDDLIITSINRTEDGFSKQWKVISESQQINLDIIVNVDDQVIITFPSNKLFEGSCKVTGTIESNEVTGFCFSEQNYKE